MEPILLLGLIIFGIALTIALIKMPFAVIAIRDKLEPLHVTNRNILDVQMKILACLERIAQDIKQTKTVSNNSMRDSAPTSEDQSMKKYGVSNYQEKLQAEQENELMKKRYGITKEGDNYCINGNSYASLSDAVNYAKSLAKK